MEHSKAEVALFQLGNFSVNINTKKWFLNSTQHLDNYHTLNHQFLKILDKEITDEVTALKRNILFNLIAIIFISLFLLIFIYIIEKSILKSVKNITRGIDNFSNIHSII